MGSTPAQTLSGGKMRSREIGSAISWLLLSLVVFLAAGCGTDTSNGEADELSSLVTSLELSSGHRDFCDQTDFLCSVGQGDCERNQCEVGLVCATDNGPRFGFSATTDVCVPLSCTNGVQDAGEQGVDCGGECGNCARPETIVLGTSHYCSEMFPCSVGEADCDSDKHCGEGLTCGDNNGPRFGYRPTVDVCVPTACANGTLDAGEEGIDCGGECGTCERPQTLVSGTKDYCSKLFPCDVGEGDCDGDSQCRGDLICGENNGPSFGLPKGYDVCELPPQSRVSEGKLGAEVMYDFLDKGVLSIADQMLDDCWELPRYDSVCLGGAPRWQENPYDEKYWRYIFYALRPLRHLLWAYRSTNDVRYRDKLIEILWSFVQESANTPFSFRWDRHTTAFRAMSLVNILQKLRSSNDMDDELDAAMVALIHEEGVFLANPRNFEGTNNHGVTEAAALLLIAHNFPQFAESAQWRQLGIDRLDALVVTIIDEDGVEIEQSPFYHFYVLMLFFQIQDWALDQSIALSPIFTERVEQMVWYATVIAAPDGLVPMLGSSVKQSIRTYQRSVFNRLQSRDDEFLYVRSAGKNGTSPQNNVVLFPTTGQAILRSGFGPADVYEDQTHLLFYLGNYRTNHSQLDALNLHVYGAGRTILTDSGLFTYEKGIEHDYYWSTRAHNTVVVDGLNQRKGTATVGLTVEEQGWGYQSGAHTLYDGVSHARGVTLIGQDIVVVVDQMRSNASHEYTQTWHLFPGAQVEGTAGEVHVQDEQGQDVLSIHQSVRDDMNVTFPFGETSPRQGWYSERYEIEQPAQVVEYRREASSTTFATVFTLGSLAGQSTQVVLSETDSLLEVRFVLEGIEYTVGIQGLAGAGEEVVVSSQPVF